jgi:O-antigen ligase
VESRADAPALHWREVLLPGAIVGACAGLLQIAPSAAYIALCVLAVAPLLWYTFANQRYWPLLFCAAAVLLPPIPFPIGDSGAHPSIVIAASGVLGGLACARQWHIHRSTLNLALIGFVGAATLSLGFAILYSGLAIAAASTARLLLFTTGLYVYFTASQGPGRQDALEAQRTARALFWIAVAAAAFGCVDFAYQLPAPAGFSAQFVWLTSGVYRRAQGLFYDASALGSFCSFFLTMSTLALSSGRLLPKRVAAFGVILFTTTLLLSFSRMAVGASVIACGTVAILERKRYAFARVLLIALASAAVAVVAFALLMPEFASTYAARLGLGSGAIATPERFFSGRLETWSTLGAFLSEHPLQAAVGIGYKTLPYTEFLGRPLVADNTYLSTFVETGVFGLAALIALNAAILVASYKSVKRGSFFGSWLFCFWTGELFQMLLGDVLTFWRVLPVIFWVLGQVVHENTAD